ncbi:MAG: RsmG family class I SAM-dependent methyltransferase [Brevinematia bacterium]
MFDTLEIEFNIELIEKLEKYINILFEWNETTNLTSVNKEEFLMKHVIFSYNYKKFIETFDNIFDFGSGNGVPGIPLSFIFPEKRFILVENKKRKIAFLEYISSHLCQNVEVINSAYEKPPKEYLKNFCVVTKAFHDIKEMKKFFKTKFELLIPTKKLITKNTKIIETFYPKMGEFKDIMFYRILVE